MALAEARRLSHAHTSAFASHMTFQADWLARSDPKVLLQVADERSALSAECGFAFYATLHLAHGGWRRVVLGHVDQGISSLNSGVAAAQVAGDVLDMPSLLIMRAEAHRMAA